MAHVIVPASLAGLAYLIERAGGRREEDEEIVYQPSMAYADVMSQTYFEPEAMTLDIAVPPLVLATPPQLYPTLGPDYVDTPDFVDSTVEARIVSELPLVEDAAKRVAGFYEAEMIQKNANIGKILDIVRAFIRDNKLVLYGGAAINALLPPEDQFYDYSKELPDYDFYSSNAREHAKQLADLLYAAGFEDAQARSGVHEGTYKVSADFQQVADISQLPAAALEQIDVVELPDGLLYAGPMWLRIDMYKQLSEIMGQQDRWPKVWKRLQLLNKNYPIGSTECPEQYCDVEGEQCDTYDLPMKKIAQTIVDFGKEKKRVFVGGMSRHVFRALDRAGADSSDITALVKTYGCLQDRVCLMDLLSEEPFEDAEELANRLRALVPNSKITVQPQVNFVELFDERFLVSIDGYPMVEFMRPYKCYGYTELDGYRLGTLDTVLTIMFGKLFVDADQLDDATKAKYICMVEFLMRLVKERGNMAGEGPFARFPTECYGQQLNLSDIFRDRWQDRIDRLILEKRGIQTENPMLMYRPHDLELVREGLIDPKYVGYQVGPERPEKF